MQYREKSIAKSLSKISLADVDMASQAKYIEEVAAEEEVVVTWPLISAVLVAVLLEFLVGFNIGVMVGVPEKRREEAFLCRSCCGCCLFALMISLFPVRWSVALSSLSVCTFFGGHARGALLEEVRV